MASPERQLVMDYTEFKQYLTEEVWPEVGDSFSIKQVSSNCISTRLASDFRL